MPTLNELTDVFRSKNAGPFLITIDLMFGDRERYDRVLNSGALNAAEIAGRYGVSENTVSIVAFPHALAIKITLPRVAGRRGSGSFADRDVYGAQQHGPLLDVAIA
ncbi:MAG: DUF4387 domain-containing protein [Hyphomicrobiaceae bacterium]|nr:DUF4387 domain-containing protein [Hyphomicrobiaceae bacterium]